MHTSSTVKLLKSIQCVCLTTEQLCNLCKKRLRLHPSCSIMFVVPPQSKERNNKPSLIFLALLLSQGNFSVPLWEYYPVFVPLMQPLLAYLNDLWGVLILLSVQQDYINKLLLLFFSLQGSVALAVVCCISSASLSVPGMTATCWRALITSVNNMNKQSQTAF